ncbi:MAG: hypothetical protein ACREPB_01655, partial [Arenimonas sp.]
MSAQNVSLSAMFGWVTDSFKLFKKNYRALMSASLVTLVLVVLMCLPMWLVMMSSMSDMMKNSVNGAMPANAMPFAGDMTTFYTMYAITIAVSLVAFPPILIGWFKLCQNIDQNKAASGFDILKPFANTQLWLRGIGFALLGLVVYAAVLGLFVLAFWGAISDLMQQVNAQQAAMLAGNTPVPSGFPVSLFFGYFAFIGIATFLQFVYMVGFTEISLRPTSPMEAMKQAAIGIFKNALKLVLLFICVGTVFYIAMLIVGLILGLIIVALSFIHPIIGAIAAFALFLPFLLCIYPLLFSGHYFMWNGIL